MAQAFVNVGVASNDGVAVNGIDKRTVFAYVGVVSLFAHENKMLRFNAKIVPFLKCSRARKLRFQINYRIFLNWNHHHTSKRFEEIPPS
jgi:hypothetical protein